jgi:hypothetical protein
MLRISTLAAAGFALGVLTFAGAANAQLPDYDSLSADCQGKYNNYINSYNDYGDYYTQLHQQYPDGNNPNDTADTLGQKIDDMYDAQDAFQKDCGPIDAFSRGSKFPPPSKSNLKVNRQR